jgi:hypothetical protein
MNGTACHCDVCSNGGKCAAVELVAAVVHVRALLGYLSGFDNLSEEAVAARAWLEEIES